ncbi:peroxisomal sarcosine oxidase-like [Lineus longissimus]|uniref:peroxisomal sarcosine oxidase-like n=1 Tax=Lineus longissimus TaxID=88925 RepID=UPI002B4D8481
MTEIFDCLVIGAGIEGSCTAFQLARNGFKTLLVEQFYLPHTRGSSHGHSRIIRKAYDKEIYTNMMKEAYSWWESIERQVGKPMLRKCGLVYCGDKDIPEMKNLPNLLTKYGVTHKVYQNARELSQDYPMFQFGDSLAFVLEKEAGMLRSDNCLAGVQKLFVKFGGKINDGTKVVEIIPGQVVTVRTTNGSYKAKSLVICAGPWAGQLLKPLGLHLPLKPIAVNVVYWRENLHGIASADKNPTFVINGDEESELSEHFYGLPADEYPNHYKFCYHSGPVVDPDDRDADKHRSINDMILKDMIRFVNAHFPTLEPKPSIVERCMYTNTPDSDFILDTHPHWKNIVIGAGFSGHGFKMAPVVGKVLMELAVGRQPSYDLSTFAIRRFDSKAKL